MNTGNLANPFLFACGVPRSGTTLLQRMLNSHPQLAVANDTHFIPRALELTERNLVSVAIEGREIALTDELASNVWKYHRFYRTGIDLAEFKKLREKSSTYRELVSGIFNWYAGKAGKPLSGEKTPDYIRRLSLLHGLFPNAKLIHLVRDGRNVALSLLQWANSKKGPGRIELWNENRIAVCALWWKWLVDQGLDQSARLKKSVCFEVRYEKLTECPEATIASLCGFLELPFEDAMLEYNNGKKLNKPGLSAKSAWLGPKTGLRDWSRDMNPTDVELFESLAGDTLQRCGFELSGGKPAPAIRREVERCVRWWHDHFLPKNDLLESQDPQSAFTPESVKKLSPSV